MGRGRRPLPTAVKKLHGNPGKRPLNELEPKPSLGAPEIPAWMPKEAAEKWHSISRELDAMGVLSKIDGEALAGLCVSWARWVEAQAEITKHGILLTEPIYKWDRKKKKHVKVGTRVTGKNPAIAVAVAELKNMLRFAVEFGLTPASRTRLSIAAPRIAIEQDQFDKYADRLGEINRVN